MTEAERQRDRETERQRQRKNEVMIPTGDQSEPTQEKSQGDERRRVEEWVEEKDQGPYAPQGSTPLLPNLSVTSKVSAPTSHAWVGSLVHFRSSEGVTLLEFTSPIGRE